MQADFWGERKLFVDVRYDVAAFFDLMTEDWGEFK